MTNLNLIYIGYEYSWLFYLTQLSILQLIITVFLVRTDANRSSTISIHSVSSMQKAYPKFKNTSNEILKYNSFPIDISMFYNTVFAAVMPISIWFLIENFKGKIKEKSHHERD